MSVIDIEMPDLADFQEEWLADPSRVKFIEGATFTGKTFVYQAEHFRLAHAPVNEGDEYWWIDPTLAQARAVFDDIVRRINEAGLSDAYKVSRMPMSITTPNGGVMRFLTADNPDYFYGIRNVRNIIVNEFTRCRLSLYYALLTVANKTGCDMAFIGNFVGEDSAWHLLINNVKDTEGFRYFRTTALRAIAAGIMPADRMDIARRTLPHTIFLALYMCEGSTDPSLLVDYGAVNDLWTNEHVPEGKPGITADIALHGSDRFVMGRWSGWRLKEIKVLEPDVTRDAKKVEAVLKGYATEHGIGQSAIAYDADGLGAYLKGYLQGGAAFQGGSISMPQEGQKMSYARLRDQVHFLTADGINARTIAIDTPMYRDELTKELLAILRKKGQNAAGQWQVFSKDEPEVGAKARLGHSPDYGDMFVMRAFQMLAPTPTLVASLAGSAKRTVSFKGSTISRETQFKGR